MSFSVMQAAVDAVSGFSDSVFGPDEGNESDFAEEGASWSEASNAEASSVSLFDNTQHAEVGGRWANTGPALLANLAPVSAGPAAWSAAAAEEATGASWLSSVAGAVPKPPLVTAGLLVASAYLGSRIAGELPLSSGQDDTLVSNGQATTMGFLAKDFDKAPAIPTTGVSARRGARDDCLEKVQQGAGGWLDPKVVTVSQLSTLVGASGFTDKINGNNYHKEIYQLNNEPGSIVVYGKPVGSRLPPTSATDLEDLSMIDRAVDSVKYYDSVGLPGPKNTRPLILVGPGICVAGISIDQHVVATAKNVGLKVAAGDHLGISKKTEYTVDDIDRKLNNPGIQPPADFDLYFGENGGLTIAPAESFAGEPARSAALGTVDHVKGVVYNVLNSGYK